MNVGELARSFNGHETWTFSQSDLSTWVHYRTMGICAALSAEWIKFHANGGSLHAVAVWLGQPTYGGAGDALLFDPSYGEYWFESKGDFFTFFSSFYRRAYRSFLKNFNQWWEVLPVR
jgi:hypothetical protein